LLLQNCDILQPILQLSLLYLWQHVLKIILHTVGCICPKKCDPFCFATASLQLQHQTISWPKYSHVDITKILLKAITLTMGLSIATTNCASAILVFLQTNFEPNHSMMLLKSPKKLCTIIWKSFSSLFSESFQIQDSTSSRYRAPIQWEEREKETIPEKKSLKKVFLPQISTESRYFWVDFKEQRWETEKGNT